ncbi:MAG: dihydrolipoyl dehydrogenase [Gammaproteobacteria bacterium]|nr:dihydrolipoyl dehydrogenase [Gammaproteobacteria bacterium]MCF6230931.1 dihydrolipoyl dehydrogenase [Gammaproteobacteria bacterium]
MNEKFDVIIIGAGPGGYVAAIRCAQLGLKTACIDDWVNSESKPSPGGTCLNVGCIPSKAMIESSEQYEKAQHELALHGVNVRGVKLDLTTLLARKDRVVNELTSGVAALLAANKVTFIHGRGKLLANKEVEVAGERFAASNIIIATGSSPSALNGVAYDGDTIVDSTGALAFDKVPKRLCVIGTGVIGLELGSVWRRLGSEVFMLKSSNTFLPMADQSIAKEALKIFSAQGLDIRMGARIKNVAVVRGKAVIEYDDKKGNHQEKVDKIIVAVGRQPNTRNLIAEDVSIEVDQRGFIRVDDKCRTAVDGIYAIGDIVRGPMLAHKASEEGVMVAELINGEFAQIDLESIPSVIYTSPEIAWVGKTEQALKQEGTDYTIGTFPFAANGRARALGETTGLIKIIAHTKTDRILGVHIIGPQASETVAQAKIAMEMGASSEDIALTVFAHPTLSEALHEAALSVHDRAIHAVQPKRKKQRS